MKKSAISVIAFCIIAVVCFAGAGTSPAATVAGTSFSVYKAARTEEGAPNFPILAQLLYHEAITNLKEGKTEQAEALLHEAVRLDPEYIDAYFTLARMEAFRFNGESFLHLASAFRIILHNFHYQSLLLVNTVIAALMALFVLATIFGIAIALKYFPFFAHKIREFMEVRFQASHRTLAAYLLLLVPFALFPGFITALSLVIILTWVFMNRREKAVILLISLIFIMLGFFSSRFKELTPVTNPKSLTLMIAKANESGGRPALIRSLEQVRADRPELKFAKNLALGLLHLRRDDFLSAADNFLETIAYDDRNAAAYINLSNTYYLQGEYEKALEGYIKAEAIDSMNAVCQYNLAQAYIKTLLLARSSTALNNAARAGINTVRASYSDESLRRIQVFPATMSSKELWRLARIEGASGANNFLLSVFVPVAHFPPAASAWILLGALIIAISVGRILSPSKLAFQCSNCGELTCNRCCSEDRGMILCRKCADIIEGISSEKVVEALLRQSRQTRFAGRRKSVRYLTCWIPGVKDIFNDRLFIGMLMVGIFACSLITMLAQGLIIRDWSTVHIESQKTLIFIPVLIIGVLYAISIFSKRHTPAHAFRLRPAKMEKAKRSTSEFSSKTASF